MRQRFLVWLSHKLWNWSARVDSWLPTEHFDYENAEPDDWFNPLADRYIDEDDFLEPTIKP